MTFIKNFDSAAKPVCEKLRSILLALPRDIKGESREIRLRAGKPLCVSTTQGELLISKNSVSLEDIQETFNAICEYSAYSYKEEIANGFITINGGHRVGICGEAVLNNGDISTLKNISSISIRISRDIKGGATELYEKLYFNSLPSILIAGPPGSGKTTIIRDLVRQISYGRKDGIKISIVDERGEIAASFNGISENDLGPYVDIFSGYPKNKGIEIATRCFSPDIIVCDELGGKAESLSIVSALNSGVGFIATAHADNTLALLRKENIKELIERHCFDHIVVLCGKETPCKIKNIVSYEELVGEDYRNNIGGRQSGTMGNIFFSKIEGQSEAHLYSDINY